MNFKILDNDNTLEAKSEHNLIKRSHSRTCSYTETLYRTERKTRSNTIAYYATTNYWGWCWKVWGGFRCKKSRDVTR